MVSAYGIFYVIFGIVGVTLNLAVAFVIANDKTMQSATYLFMVQLALADAEAVLGIVLGPGLRMVANARAGSLDIFVKLIAYCDACGFRLSLLWMIFVAMSRWAHFSKQGNFNSFFTKKNHIIFCVFLWLAVHVFYSVFLFVPGSFTPLGDDSGAYIYTNMTVSQVIRFWDEATSYASGLLQLIFNGLSVGLILRMRNQIVSPELKAKNKREIKLSIQCGIDFVIFFLLQSFYYYSVYGEKNDEWIAVIIEVTLLVNHIDCAVLYLCFNKKLRSIISGYVRKKLHIGGKTTAVVPMNTAINTKEANNNQM